MRLTTSNGRFAIANFSLLLIYVWLFTCVRLRFATSDVRCATAIFSIWDRKNRMASEFRWMSTEYWEGWNKIRYRKSAVGCRKPHTCIRRLSCTQHTPIQLQTRATRFLSWWGRDWNPVVISLLQTKVIVWQKPLNSKNLQANPHNYTNSSPRLY